MTTTNSVSIGILGATGYTGVELLRLLADHPAGEVRALTSERHAGQPLSAVFPHLLGRDLPDLIRMEEVDYGALDVVFGCLPHGTTQDVIRDLPRGPKIVDLSADFRLRDPA
ncbi:MAG TPA: N-acetyl-gamma-glutamyl-phosphate reductase, partial [Geminicoccaceae bacterium]